MEPQALQRWQYEPQRATRALIEGSAASAVALLQQMQKAEVEVNVFHYCAAMSVCTKASEWTCALGCFEDCRQRGCPGAALDAKLKAVGSCGWEAALEGLHAVQTAGMGIQVDTVSFNPSMGGEWQHALAFPQIMRQEDLAASVITFNCSMVAQGPENWPWALQILSEMHQQRLSNDVTLTAILGTLRDEEMTLWRMALETLDDAATWSSEVGWKKGRSVTLGLCNAQRWELAMALLHATVDVGIEVVGYSSAIAACEKAGRWQLTLLILEMMKVKKVIANNFSYNSAMSACGKHSAWRKALELFEEMQSFRVEQDVVTYNALLEALVEGQSGSVSDGGPAISVACLASMAQAAVVPNVITYSTTLMAFEKEHHWEEGLDLLQLMQGKLIQLDVISYNSAMSACRRVKHWQMAWQLLSLCAATVISFGILCDGPWYSSLEALRAVQGLTGTTATTVTPLEAAALSCERGRVARPLVALLHQLDQASWLRFKGGAPWDMLD